MSHLFLCSILFTFFILAKESIVYEDDRSECNNINEIILKTKLIKTSDYPVNKEFCSRHNDAKLGENKCCISTLFFRE